MKKKLLSGDFVAIDFETASLQRSSVCSVGLVLVRRGAIAGKMYSLIRPRPNFYSDWATRVHGLSYADTDTAPDFPRVWDDARAFIEGLPLVAHNSTFDEGCLRAAHEIHGLPYPGYEFHCTWRASARMFPALPNHRLHTVAAHVGYSLQHHHHALADAEACAEIALRVFPRESDLL